MTFDDGILTVYDLSNGAHPGDMPKEHLEEKEAFYYSYDRLGITRYYTAKQANQDISAVVNIPGWGTARATDIVILQEEPEAQYRISMIQPEKDENGLKITKLTLERVGQRYEVFKTG